MTPDEYLNQADEYIAAKSTKNPNAGSAEPKVFTERELGFQPRRTWGEAIKDTGAALAGGVAGLGKTAGDLYGLASGDMDNALSRYSQKGQEYFDEAKSGALKEKIAERSANIDAQDSTLGKAWTAVKDTMTDPALAMDTAASNAATMIPGMGAGRLAGGITAARGFAAAQAAAGAGKAITKEAADQVAMRAGRVATGTAIGTGAVQQGADVSGDIYGDLLKNTDAQWAQSPEYVAALQRNGGDAQAAKRELALGVARASFLPATAISVASNAIPGATLLERALVGAPAGAAAKAGAKEAGKLAGIRAFAKGVLGEGAQEFVEEGGGRLAANIAAQRVDPSHDTLDQVGENAGLGFAGGALLGIGGGVREGLAARRGFQPGADQQPGIDGAPPASVPPADGGQPLALPAPVIDVGGDGVARTADDRNARTQRINSGDITDVTPIRETPFGAAEAPVIEPAPVVQPPTPSEQLGLRSGPDAGTMEDAAALAVDSGASPIAQTVDADGVLQDAAQGARGLSTWTDEELSSAFRSAQAKEVRQQLAQEIADRRERREQQALQDELDADQQALNEPELPEGADAAFARTFEDEGDTVFQPRQEQGDGTQAQETQQAGAGQPQAGAAQTNAGAGENASAAGRGGVQEGGMTAKRALYDAYKATGAPDDVVAASVLKVQEKADALGAPVSVWRGAGGTIGVVPASQSSPFKSGELIATVHPNAASASPTARDESHLNALQVRLSHERARLGQAKTEQERAARQVTVDGVEREIASERKFLGLPESPTGEAMSDDELLQALRDEAPAPQPAAPTSAPTPKQQKALDRIANGKAYFFSQPKAQAFIDDNDLSGTHALEQRGKSWHVVEVPKSEVAKIDAAANEAATSPQSDRPEPTQAQKEAGNYAKGHIQVQGLDISIENPQGSERAGTDKDGKEWRHTMSHHYGYIKRTSGADGDQVDVYVGPNPASPQVFVVDQINQGNGQFDEHKVMLGFDSEADAVAAYRSNFDSGWKVGPVRAMSMDDFKGWLKDGDTTKPAAESSEVDSLRQQLRDVEEKILEQSRGHGKVSVALKAQRKRLVDELNQASKQEAVDGARQEPTDAGASGPVANLFSGKPDPANSGAMPELGGFKPGDSVDVFGRTTGRSTVELLYRKSMKGFDHPLDMARIVAEDGKKLDILTSELRRPAPEPVAAKSDSTVKIPASVDTALTADMHKQQAKVKRLRTAATADGLTLAEKTSAQTKAAEAEDELRKMRLSRFDAEDAVQASIKAGNPGPFSAHADLFPQAQQALVQHLLAAPGAPVDVQQTLKGAVSTGHLTNDQVAQVEAMTNKAKMPQRKSPGDPGYTLLDARNDLIDLRNQSEAQGIVADDRLAERVRRQEKLVAEMEAEETAASAKPAPKKKPSADQVRAQADLMNALADLGDILGKNTRMNIVPEQEQKLLPVLTRVLDAAFRLGYHKFKDSAKFALDQIRAHLGAEAADALTLDHLQGAYIAMAGGKEGVDTKRAVIDVETKVEIEQHEAAIAQPDDGADNDTQEVATNERTAVQGDGPQALEPVAAGAGQGTEGSGRAGADAVGGRDERPAARSGADAAGVQGARGGRGGSERVHSSEAGDGGRVRKPGRVKKTPEQAAAEKAIGPDTRPEVAGDPASAANIPATNFQITEETRLGEGGEVAKFNDNLAAIRTLKAVEQENRRATPQEQITLARYVGWGGLANAFPDPLTGKHKGAWEARGKELRDLLDDAEYAAARRSTRNAHFTSKPVVEAMWRAVERLGFKGGLALETSMGVGNFLGLKPQGTPASFVGVEYDSLTARIAQALYPQATVLHSGFQDVPLPDNAFALSIGNPPFGSESLRFQYKPELNGVSIHNQFFRASMDALRPGGIQAMVVSRYLMDAKDKSTRLALAKQAKLVAAFRLPDTAFKENARTEVVTDIIILQKLTPAEQAEMDAAVQAYTQRPEKSAQAEGERRALAAKVPSWVETADVADPLGGEAMTVNSYFRDNAANIMGVMERSGSMQHGADITVRLDDAASLERLLAQAVDRLPQNLQDFGADVIAASEQRHKSMSDALRIALAGQEVGHVQLNRDGVLERVVERETPEGGIEMGMQAITAESPWSDQLMQDAQGRWYRNEVVMGEDGKAVKAKKADGTVLRTNLTQRVTYESEADVPGSLRLGKTGFERLQAAVGLRDSLKRQIMLETADAAKGVMDANRRELAKRYEAFVAKFGPVNRPVNLNLIMTMPDGGLTAALEVAYQPEVTAARARTSGLPVSPEVAKPAPILTERVVPKYEPATTAATPYDALAIALSETGRVDMDRIARLRGLTAEEAAAELQAGEKPLVFKDPESQSWETADAYLSGNVRRKLNAARVARMDANVKALEAVQPAPWGAEDVTVMLGSTWVPTKVYADFAQHLSGGQAKVSFSAATNSFSVNLTGATAAAQEWSSQGASVDYILGRLMNSQPVVVMYKDENGSLKRDTEATALAQLKAKEISAEFLDWVFKDGERRTALVDLFNEKYNTRVVRQRDGSHLALPGKVPDSIIGMRRHQKNVIWRGITDNALLMDHAVGAGKTFAAIARAMERRRMGLSKKPMIVVPNHLIDQWAADVYRLYPGAKVLAAGKKDFETKRRRRLFGKIATGDWDIVLVPHSSFGFIGIDSATEQRFLQLEMDQALQAVKDAEEQAAEDGTDGGRRKPFGVKEAERLVEKIQARMDKLNSGTKDRLLTFEQLGVDDLTVDEAHEFKNLYYSSRMTGVRGMGDKTGSRKANDLYNKVRVLQENPANSVTFLTGTPISNSAVEMYTVMRYLAPQQLKDMGLEHFDAWRAQFVEASEAFEPTESGSLKSVSRLGRSWSNMRSLMDLYYEFTDAVSLEDIQRWYSEDNGGKPFPVPKVKGGDRKLVNVKPTKAQEEMLREVIAGFDGLDSIQDPYERNAERLRLMDRARKVSLDVRAVDPRSTSDEAGGKLAQASEQIKRIYDQWSDDKGAQMVFLDRSVPRAKGDDKVIKEYDALVSKRDEAMAKEDDAAFQAAQEALDRYDANEIAELRSAQSGGWNAYQQIKDNLIAMGVPANEIRFIQEANNDEQKQALFDAVNSGKVRVLLGSSQRMGAGTNAQKRLVGLHHIDVTWKPSDIEQREGRIIRQGNELLAKYGDQFEVEILAYATERTVDAKMWDLNATKLKTINGIRKYDGAFTMDFEDADSVSMAEMAALASGNPLLLERVKTESEINTLELQERAFRRRMYAAEDAVRSAERTIERNPARIKEARERYQQASAAIERAKEQQAARQVTVEGKEYTGLREAHAAKEDAIAAQQEGNPKARYSLTVDGQHLTNKEGIEAAIGEALGDASVFEATINGRDLTQRTTAARALAEEMNQLTRGIKKGDSRNKTVGKMLGYDLALDANAYDLGNGSSQIDASVSLVDADGGTVASISLSEIPVNQSYVTANLRNPVSDLFQAVERMAERDGGDYLQRQLDRATAELPALRERLGQAFPKADELAAKRARLRELVSLLDGAKVGTDESAAVRAADEAADRHENDTANFAPSATERPGTTQDKAVMRAIADGKSTRDVLRLIASSSKNPFNRQVARLLLKAGVTPDIVFGHIGKRGADGIHGQYRGKTDTIHIAGSAEYAAERIFLHEAMHAATMRALRKKGLHSIQLRKLFEHVSKQKSLAGFYGIKNVDEFVAEVFTNPDFQRALKGIDAPSGSVLKTAWDSFVRILRSILGLGNDTHSALSQALNLGVGVVREDMLIRRRGGRADGVANMTEKLRGLARMARAPGNANETVTLGPLSARELALLRREGVPVEDGFSHTIDMFAVRHAINRHGDEKAEARIGQLPVSDADVAAAAQILNEQDAFILGAKTPRGQDIVGSLKQMPDGTVLYLEEVRSGRKTLAMTSMRKYPGTTDFETIRNRIVPSYARSDTGDVRIVYPDDTGSQDIANFGTDEVARNIGDGLKSITVPNVKRLGKHKLTDWLKMGLQFLGRRQLVDIYGDMLPMAEYDRLAAQMEADKNESGAEADELVRRWAKLPDDGKLADLMHEATLAQIDADSAVAHDPGDDQMQSRALKGRFDALSPEAQKVYREARDSYRAHHAQVRQAIKDRIERSELSSSKRAELLKRMDDDFFQKVKGVYFPLARFGQYVVAVKDADGQVVSVSRAETMPEAERARAQLLGAFPKEKGFSVGRVTLDKEFVASHKMVGRGFMTDLYRAMEGIDLPTDQLAELEDTLGQLYLSSLPDLSWAKHGIHRKGTPGFSQDARRAFAQNTFHGARYLAKLRYGDRMQAELEAMQKHVDEWSAVEDFDQPGAQRVVDEMMKRHDTMMNPKSNPLATAMTSLGFVYYLGLSPAAAVVNLSQTGLVAYPVMAAKWGYAKTASALLKASEESVRGKNDIRTQLKSQDEMDAYDRAVASGVIDVTQAHDLAGVAQGEDQRVAWKLRPVMKAASFLFHHAERFNRQATFMAAYRLAKEAGSKNAYEDAVKATYDGHFDYSACVDDATEILTNTGWRKRSELRVGDVAIATDADGRAVESKVLNVNVYEGQHEVIEFSSSRRFNMVLTPNHDAVIQTYSARDKKWQSPRKVRADSLKNHHFLLRAPLAPVERNGVGIGTDLASLLGWIAAEGWYSKYRKCSVPTDVRLGQSETHNPEYASEIRGILDRLGGEYKEYTYKRKKDVFTTFVLRRSLGRLVQEHLPEKILTPKLVEAMSTDEMRAFITSFLKGDGTQREDGNRSWMVGQKNGTNLDLLQAMAIMCGMRASITPANEKGMAYLYVVDEDDGHRSHVRPLKQVRRMEPLVWCPTTEHGTWIARRNGAVFVTGNSNRPRVMQGNVARVVLLFKQFAQNMIYTIGRQAYLSVQGESPEVKKQARKTFAGLMVTHAMGAGVLGLPLVAPLLAVASALGGDDDEPWDAEAALRNMLADTFGPKASEVIAKGLSRLTPWDISGRVGLDSLIFPDVQEGIEGQRWAESFATGMLGPVIGMGVNAAKAAQSLGDGNYQRALEEFMPVMPRSSVKAYRYWTEGDKDKTGVVVKDEVGLAGVLGQVAGFSPSEVRLAREGRSAVLDQDRRLGERRSELLAQYAHAAMRGDAEGKQKAADAIRAFNEKNPTRRITVPQMMQSVRNRQRRIDQAQDGVYLPRTRRDAAQAGAFALDGA